MVVRVKDVDSAACAMEDGWRDDPRKQEQCRKTRRSRPWPPHLRPALLGPAAHLFVVVWRLGSSVHEYDGHGPASQIRRRPKHQPEERRRRTTNIEPARRFLSYRV